MKSKQKQGSQKDKILLDTIIIKYSKIVRVNLNLLFITSQQVTVEHGQEAFGQPKKKTETSSFRFIFNINATVSKKNEITLESIFEEISLEIDRSDISNASEVLRKGLFTNGKIL